MHYQTSWRHVLREYRRDILTAVAACAVVVSIGATQILAADNRSHHDDSYTDPVSDPNRDAVDRASKTDNNKPAKDCNCVFKANPGGKNPNKGGKKGADKNSSSGNAAHNNQDCAGCN